jgi:sugar (glycoside-pentoside-hexuronide) transporter
VPRSSLEDGVEILPARVKTIFALGDHTLNLTLSALSLFYLYYLTEYVGLRPALASLVLLVGRCIDACVDPLMGRLSDQTRWRSGRRRPYFLIGAIPFGISFAALWVDYPVTSQLGKFGVYACVYLFHSLMGTVLTVPYMALLPELTLDYQERTSINTYRSVASVAGTLVAAAAFRPLAEAFGGGTTGYAYAGLCAAGWVVWPWVAIHRATWERPEFQRESRLGLLDGLRALAAHSAYRKLTMILLCSRIAMDVVAATFVFYFAYWLRRPGDFELTLSVMLLTVVASLPLWLWASHFRDKAQIFIIGAAWWIGVQVLLWFVTPLWPPWTMLLVAVLAGIGYAVADMMPWAMLGDVIDEDELTVGERREGLYAGSFTFLRKLGGASAVAVAGIVLDLAGFVGGQEPAPLAVATIRALTAFTPIVFLLAAVAIAVGYPITRARHREIVSHLAARHGDSALAKETRPI